MRTPQLANEVVARVAAVLEPARDPDRATVMAAYMKDQFAYLGIPSPERRAVVRATPDGLPRPTEQDMEYSKTDAAAVRCFVADHKTELSRLSRRGALKWLDRRAARAAVGSAS